jgi:hypothetical protein
VRLPAVALCAALAVALVVPGNTYKNCDALRKVYPYGVAKDAASVGNTRATVNAKVYKKNKGLDRDRDGVACES